MEGIAAAGSFRKAELTGSILVIAVPYDSVSGRSCDENATLRND